MGLKVGRGASAPPFMVMDVISAANARQAALPPGAPGVIRMEVGQPGTGAPAGAVEAAHAALRSGDPLGYTEAFGRRSLRERISRHYRDWYGFDVSADRVAVTVGASGAFPLAFLAAFDCQDELRANIAGYRRSRDYLLKALPEAGFDRLSPAEGAFYLFADISERSNDSMAFCARILAETGVAVTPGVDFDRTRGNRFLRFSYCGPEGDMREAAARLKAWG